MVGYRKCVCVALGGLGMGSSGGGGGLQADSRVWKRRGEGITLR